MPDTAVAGSAGVSPAVVGVSPNTLSHLFSKAFLVFLLCATLTADAQIQQAWVVKYNNHFTTGSHQALKVALDSVGNIVVCGVSQNGDGGTGYATIKYAPNGKQLWSTRLDTDSVTNATPAGLALDRQGQPALTGNAGTIKYDSSGGQLWFAPYAGLAIAADTNANTFITGFGTNFNTGKLSPTGTVLWGATSKDVGPTIGQGIAVDANDNVYVSGYDLFGYDMVLDRTFNLAQLLTVKFASNGLSLWKATAQGPPMNTSVSVAGMSVDKGANSYVVVNFSPEYGGVYAFDAYGYSSGGGLLWYAAPGNGGGARGLAVAPNGETVLAGESPYGTYADFGLVTNGSILWINYYPNPASGASASLAVATDSGNNAYITGYSPDANGTNDIVTIAYDTSGKQLWLQRYTGLGYGAVGNAIAADNNGNVYVAGYENVLGGGTEMVLIKYAPVTVQHQSNGDFLLEAQGSPGEGFDIQATTNLQTWLDLGTNYADTNGLLQYLDTNAPLFPSRFYLTIPQ